jgi:hypothetical protein
MSRVSKHHKKAVNLVILFCGGEQFRSSSVNQLLTIPIGHDFGNSILNVGRRFVVELECARNENGGSDDDDDNNRRKYNPKNGE